MPVWAKSKILANLLLGFEIKASGKANFFNNSHSVLQTATAALQYFYVAIKLVNPIGQGEIIALSLLDEEIESGNLLTNESFSDKLNILLGGSEVVATTPR